MSKAAFILHSTATATAALTYQTALWKTHVKYDWLHVMSTEIRSVTMTIVFITVLGHQYKKILELREYFYRLLLKAFPKFELHYYFIQICKLETVNGNVTDFENRMGKNLGLVLIKGPEGQIFKGY
uniref:Uncharacterized protein n=1 Tax=Romanomermis culicivorax TaxID=13658 RepID=A0A915HRK0_ROMCU